MISHSTTICIRAGFLVLIALLCFKPVFAASNTTNHTDTLYVSDYDNNQYIENILYYEDGSQQLSIEDIAAKKFLKGAPGVQNMGVSPAVFWFKLTVHNDSDLDDLVFVIDNSLLNSVTFYQETKEPSASRYTAKEVSKYTNYAAREIKNTLPEFQVNQEAGTTATYYFRIESFTQLLVPIKVLSLQSARSNDVNSNLLHGMYFGIMLVVFFYNLFVFISIKDKSYLYYIFYVLAIALVQLNVTGIGFKYIWPNSPVFERNAVFIFPSLTAFTSILFVHNFLNIKLYAPKIRMFFLVFVLFYLITIFISALNKYAGYELINANALPLALFMLGVAAYIYKKHKYRPAAFFLIAWTTFLTSIIVFVLKDYGILPYNNLTVYSILLGSALEVVLLSFALADKINILEAQNRISREKVLLATKENARIISEQNVILEQNVQERTHELQLSNQGLENALEELKEAQSQLVESEKMASLGQLTAGIAHEINNPINFVTSNVTPLRRDIVILQELLEAIEELSNQDISREEKQRKIEELKEQADFDYLKTEIDYLLKGISEGASRTSDIVKGLRLFSRLDEDDVKYANLEEGLDSTIAIVNHLLNGKIAVERNYEGLPPIECFPGKLNQVFLNMMTNAIHAIQERWGNEDQGKLTISTSLDGDQVKISLADNGVGMKEETKKKLFEPFFTTKEVGLGTGLGLSIGWNTIKKHNGTIQVNSEIGVGTEFILTIPIHHHSIKND